MYGQSYRLSIGARTVRSDMEVPHTWLSMPNLPGAYTGAPLTLSNKIYLTHCWSWRRSTLSTPTPFPHFALPDPSERGNKFLRTVSV